MDHLRPVTQRARRISFAIAFTMILGILTAFAAHTNRAPWTSAAEPACGDRVAEPSSDRVARVDDASSSTASDDAFSLVDLVHRLLE